MKRERPYTAERLISVLNELAHFPTERLKQLLEETDLPRRISMAERNLLREYLQYRLGEGSELPPKKERGRCGSPVEFYLSRDPEKRYCHRMRGHKGPHKDGPYQWDSPSQKLPNSHR